MNNNILITGSAIRIGSIIAKFLHAKGYNLILHYNTSRKEAHELSELLNAQRPYSALLVQGDLTCVKQLKTVAETALGAWGTLFGLVNNAALFFPDNSSTSSEAHKKLLMDCNVRAPLLLSEWLAPALKKQGGSIVNIGDIHGSKPLKGYKDYSASKSALIDLTKNLACTLSPAVRVNMVSPGPTLPPLGENALTKKQQLDLKEKTLLKRLTNPLDVASAVLFCLENQSLTGQNLVLDSGRSLKRI